MRREPRPSATRRRTEATAPALVGAGLSIGARLPVDVAREGVLKVKWVCSSRTFDGSPGHRGGALRPPRPLPHQEHHQMGRIPVTSSLGSTATSRGCSKAGRRSASAGLTMWLMLAVRDEERNAAEIAGFIETHAHDPMNVIETHAHDPMNVIETDAHDTMNVDDSSLYRGVLKLTRLELSEATKGAGDRTGADRTYFRLTSTGRRPGSVPRSAHSRHLRQRRRSALRLIPRTHEPDRASRCRGVAVLRRVAGPTGFEPAISSVTGWHVGPLHHGPAGATVAEYSRGARPPRLRPSAFA